MVNRHIKDVTIVLREQYGQSTDPFVQSESVVVESTQYMSPSTDGQHIEIVDLRGNLADARKQLAADVQVTRYDVVGAGEAGVAYIKRRSIGLISDLLSIIHEYDFVLDWPIEHRLIDDVFESRVTAIGTSTSIQRAASELPDEFEIELKRVGRLDPKRGTRPEILTDRQRDLLEFVAERGYYEVPRQTTHRDLAAELELAAGTVSKRLQRIERRLVISYLDQ